MSDLYNPEGFPYGVSAATVQAGQAAPGKHQFYKPDGTTFAIPMVPDSDFVCTSDPIVIRQQGVMGQGGSLASPEDPDNAGRPLERFKTASCTYQVPVVAGVAQIPFGTCYIEGTFDPGAGGERYLVEKYTVTERFDSYWLVAIEFVKDHTITPS